MFSTEVRKALVRGGLTAGAVGHPIGWVALALALADDVVEQSAKNESKTQRRVA